MDQHERALLGEQQSVNEADREQRAVPAEQQFGVDDPVGLRGIDREAECASDIRDSCAETTHASSACASSVTGTTGRNHARSVSRATAASPHRAPGDRNAS
jgi:hypothetical protein